MENDRIFTTIKVMLLLFMAFNTHAIDLAIGGGSILPNPIVASTPYTISFDINNVVSSTTNDNAATVIVTISGFNLTNIDQSATLPVSGTMGWSCSFNTTTMVAINCDKTFVTGQFSPGTTQPFSVQIQTGTSVINPDTFLIHVGDSLFTDEFPANNEKTITTLSGPVVIFGTGVTESQIDFHHAITTPQLVHYQVKNVAAADIPPIVIGAGTIPAATFTVEADAGFVISDSIISSGWSCSPVGSSTIKSCSINTFLASAVDDFEFNIIPNTTTSAGSYNLNATLSVYTTQVEAIFTNLVVINPDIVLEKNLVGGTFTQNSGGEAAHIGDTITYKVLVKNLTSGSSSSNDIEFKDTLPAGLSNLQIQSQLGAFVGGCSINAGLTEVACSTTSLPYDATGIVKDGVIITADVTGAIGTIVTNESAITIVDFDATPNGLVAADSFQIVEPVPTVSIAKTVVGAISGSVPTFRVGDSVTYRIEVENTGSTAIAELVVSDVLDISVFDAGNVAVNLVSQAATTSFTCAYDNISEVSCTDAGTATFVQNDKLILEISVITTATGIGVSNTATVNAASLNSNSTPVLINIEANSTVIPTTISVEKNAIVNGQQVTSISRGSSFVYEIIINNIGNGNLVGVTATDVMPAGIVVNSINTPTGMICNNAGQTYNCNYNANFPPNTNIKIEFNVTDNSSASVNQLHNTATVTASNAQTRSAENILSFAGSLPVAYIIDLNDDIDPVSQGGSFNYIATLRNTGSVPLESINVVFTIPTELTINSVVTNGMDCNSITTGLACSNSSGANALLINPGNQQDIVIINVQAGNSLGTVVANVTASSSSGPDVMATESTTIEQNSGNNNQADLSVAVTNEASVNQGYATSFDVIIENMGPDSANRPTVDLTVTGLIDTLSVVANSTWGCQVNGLAIRCDFNDAEMANGHTSTIAVTANLTQVSILAENLDIITEITSSSNDLVASNNIQNASVNVNPTPTEGEIFTALQDALAGMGNQQTNRAIQNVASYCERRFFRALEGMCSDLYQTALDGNGETINTVMQQITPNEVIGQSTSISEITTAQFRNIGARLSQLRGGGSAGFSTAGLNASYGNGSIPLGMLAYLSKDVDEVKNVNNDFISPWGFFVNGTISMGERDATGRELGFDFDSYGLTAGVDYRLNAKKVIGVALGYANFDSEIDGQAELASSGLTLTGYGSFYVNDNFYIDARISAGKPDFEQKRNINFTLAGTTIARVATAETSANQYSAAMSAGYHFNKKSWNITPNASFRYITTSIDSFTETGAGDFNFEYSKQELESMIWSAGLKISKAISLKNGVITPQLDLDYNYESLNDGNDIEARFVMAPTDEIFIIETDSPDRTYGSAGLGFAYVSSNGKQAYINYRTILGLEGFTRGTINLGARFEF